MLMLIAKFGHSRDSSSSLGSVYTNESKKMQQRRGARTEKSAQPAKHLFPAMFANEKWYLAM
jgi:hypothetical protein